MGRGVGAGVSVGANVGTLVGSVGPVVGWLVGSGVDSGFTVGSSLGACVGRSVGRRVGWGVGRGVGTGLTLGGGVGSPSEGSFVATMDGLWLGDGVGMLTVATCAADSASATTRRHRAIIQGNATGEAPQGELVLATGKHAISHYKGARYLMYQQLPSK